MRQHERGFAADFRALSLSAQRLYVRLISRRGPCFRRDRLAYAEIDELDRALDDLRAADFLDDAHDESLASLLPLLLRGELVALAHELLSEPPPKTGRKDHFLLTLLEQVPPEDLGLALRQRIHIVRPRRHEVLPVFRLLYFGNLYQDWTEFVLRDLGVVRFEGYKLQRDLRRFDCRQAVDDHILIRHLDHQVHQAMTLGEIDDAHTIAHCVAASRSAWHPLTERRQDSLLLTVARQAGTPGGVGRRPRALRSSPLAAVPGTPRPRAGTPAAPGRRHPVVPNHRRSPPGRKRSRLRPTFRPPTAPPPGRSPDAMEASKAAAA